MVLQCLAVPPQAGDFPGGKASSEICHLGIKYKLVYSDFYGVIRNPFSKSVSLDEEVLGLLNGKVDAQRHLKVEANKLLLADNPRRVKALADLADSILNTAISHANAHEINAYLKSRDLGISPRHDLNAERSIRLEARCP